MMHRFVLLVVIFLPVAAQAINTPETDSHAGPSSIRADNEDVYYSCQHQDEETGVCLTAPESPSDGEEYEDSRDDEDEFHDSHIELPRPELPIQDDDFVIGSEDSILTYLSPHILRNQTMIAEIQDRLRKGCLLYTSPSPRD